MTERPIILFRDHDMDEDEKLAMLHNFRATPSRINIKENDLVIGRFSVLPFYEEQERDIKLVGARLINTKAQHDYVADLGQWVRDFEGWTPRTWGPGQYADIPEDKSFVLKGKTNSKKFLWNTHMFAPTKQSVQDVLRRLLDDSLLSHQEIYIREYIPLEVLDYGLNGLPIARELRFFVANRKVLCGAFYWSSHTESIKERGFGTVPVADEVPELLISHIVETVGDKIPFYAFDVAKTYDGRWMLVELNDGQMAGIADNDPFLLYKNLKLALQ